MDKSINDGKACAALSYVLIGIIWFFADEKMKKNSFAKFHAKQGLVLLIAAIAWSIVLGILSPLLFFLWYILYLLSFVPLVLAIIGILNSVNGKEKELPIIGHFAKKLTF